MAPKRQSKKQKTGSSSQTRNILSSQPYAQARKEKLMKKNFMNSHFLDWTVMEDYGLKETLENLVVDKRWFKVFDMREPAYRKLTIEFLSTMRFSTDSDNESDSDDEEKLTFQVYGEVKRIPLRKIGVLMGYYADDTENANLPSGWPNDATMEGLWFELIHPKTEAFEPSKSVSTSFAHMEHKLLHHVIAHTLTCRKTSHNKLSTFDMFYLYSLVKNYQVDLGIEVANFLLRQADDTRTKLLFCGGYVTQLLKAMGEFQEPVNDVKVPSKRLSAGPFRSWGLQKISRGVPSSEEPVDTEIQPIIPTFDRPSSSSAPRQAQPSNQSVEEKLDRMEAQIKDLSDQVKQEKKKNKKFRSTLINVLKTAISCFHPSEAQEIKYSTSEESDSESDQES